jgi:hypothetical protein
MAQEKLFPNEPVPPRRETLTAAYAARFRPSLKTRAMKIAEAKDKSFNELLNEALERLIDGEEAHAA